MKIGGFIQNIFRVNRPNKKEKYRDDIKSFGAHKLVSGIREQKTENPGETKDTMCCRSIDRKTHEEQFEKYKSEKK